MTTTTHTRALTDDEENEFDGQHEHTNRDGRFCCPHCLRSSDVAVHVGKTPKVTRCPSCRNDFVIWTGTEVVYRSAPLSSERD